MLQHLTTGYRDASSHIHTHDMTRRVVSRFTATRRCYVGLKEVAWQGVEHYTPSPQQTPITAITAPGRRKGLSPGTAEDKKGSALTHAMLCYAIVVVVDLLLIAGQFAVHTWAGSSLEAYGRPTGNYCDISLVEQSPLIRHCHKCFL